MPLGTGGSPSPGRARRRCSGDRGRRSDSKRPAGPAWLVRRMSAWKNLEHLSSSRKMRRRVDVGQVYRDRTATSPAFIMLRPARRVTRRRACLRRPRAPVRRCRRRRAGLRSWGQSIHCPKRAHSVVLKLFLPARKRSPSRVRWRHEPLRNCRSSSPSSLSGAAPAAPSCSTAAKQTRWRRQRGHEVLPPDMIGENENPMARPARSSSSISTGPSQAPKADVPRRSARCRRLRDGRREGANGGAVTWIRRRRRERGQRLGPAGAPDVLARKCLPDRSRRSRCARPRIGRVDPDRAALLADDPSRPARRATAARSPFTPSRFSARVRTA